MKIKTSELTDAALDCAVAMALGNTGHFLIDGFSPSTNWSQGGPIIEREGIGFTQFSDYPQWTAKHPQAICFDGPTPLIAAMRCYVASKLGDEVEIPEELK